ncbi:hypothetical protein FRB96_002023 [Tulasnella sp. 330]|nr:hypothetical protein FRB96_002023 [Tulasnella sp. 330]KAG8877111.1 hypothetical protein FRB97_003675 [Tulasnella sp. 331]
MDSRPHRKNGVTARRRVIEAPSAPAVPTTLTTPFEKTVALVTTPMTSSVPSTNCPIQHTFRYLVRELDVSALDDILGYLWLAGPYARKTGALHRHQVLGRHVTACEEAGLHLVTHRNTLFIKPIPPCLLHYDFVEKHIAPVPELRHIMLGFLSTYLRLIQHESDFHIALNSRLVPSTVTYADWLKFAQSLQDSLTIKYPGNPTPYPPTLRTFNNRFDFGELRLSRLNLIMRFFRGQIIQGYLIADSDYTSYFRPFFAQIILVYAYLGIALGAFQVVQGGNNPAEAVVQTGYWMAIVTLWLLAAAAIIPAIWFSMLFIRNIMYARSSEARDDALV